MVSAPCTYQRGWQRGCRRGGMNNSFPRRGDPYSWSPPCRPAAAVPSGNTPTGSTPTVGVLDRAPTPGSASPAATSALASTNLPSPSTTQALPDRTMGYLSLSLVPILWGTYNPCIRYLYADTDPLDPASLTAVRTLLSAGALLVPALVGYLVKQGREAWRRRQAQQLGTPSDGTGSDAQGVSASLPQPLGATLAAASDGAADGMAAVVAAEEVASAGPSSAWRASSASSASSAEAGTGTAAPKSLFAEPVNSARLGPIMTRTFDSVILGGLELGLLNFLGTALQVEGLHSTSATRAGFLAEVTAVLTPLVSFLAGYEIPRQMWLAVAVGLVGSTMVAYDTSQAHDSQADSQAAPSSPVAAGPAAASAPGPSSAAASSAAAASTAAMGHSSDANQLPSAAVETTMVGLPLTSTPAASDTSPGPVNAVRQEAEIASGVAPIADAAPSAASVLDGTDARLPSPQLYAAAAQDPQNLDIATTATDYAAAAMPSAAITYAPDVSSSAPSAELAYSLSSATVEGASSAVTANALTLMVTDAASAISATGADAASLVSSSADNGAAVQAAATSALEAMSTGAAAPSATGAAAAAVEVATAAAVNATPLAITGGEAYLLLACLFYSVCTVRMGIYAPRMDTVGLAAMKKVGLSSMSILWMAATNLQNGVAPGAVLSFPDLSSRTPTTIAVLMYSGLGPGALATFLQVTGLSTVPATTAQVIYSITPLCTAFFAYLILGGEATGPVAWAGGSLIIFAALMAADAQQKQYKQQQQEQQQQQ